jgi:predicted nucleic acid-binding protein
VDASVAAKRYLDDEEHLHEARQVLRVFAGDRIALIAPDHIRYEIANTLLVAARRSRLSELVARTGLFSFLNLRIPTVGDDRLLFSAYDLASTFGCALYDGLYLALAESTDCSLLHADDRLHNTLGGRFPWELWIEDFAPPGGS